MPRTDEQRAWFREYQRKRRGFKGHYSAARLDKRASLEERFWAQTRKMESCWEWIGTLRNGYGAIAIKKDGKWSLKYAHRLAYELLIGEIPQGLTLDHLCRNRKCVNPKHLEPVSAWENRKRAIEGDTSEYMKKLSKLGAKARWGR